MRMKDRSLATPGKLGLKLYGAYVCGTGSA